MKLRNEWMTDNEYFGADYPNNILLEDAVMRFETQRDESLEGKSAIVDGVVEEIVVQNHTNMLNQLRYDKKIFCDMNSLVHTGSLVQFDNKTWLVATKVFDNLAYKTSSVLECNNIINIYKKNILYQTPCIIESGIRLFQLGTESTKYIETPSSTIVCRLPNNEITRLIKRSEVYKIGLQNYLVKDFNDVIENGLIILKLEYSEESQLEYNYAIQILNGDNIDIQKDTTLQLNVNVYNNDQLISPTPNITYISSDTEIATVNSTGLITTLQEGNVTITAKLTNDLTVLDTIELTIQEEIEDDFVVDIYGESQVVLSDTITINSKIYNNGVEDENKGVVWVLSNDDGSESIYLSVLSSTIHSITLQASSNANYKNKYVTIKGTLIDGVVYDEHVIKLVSLF